MQGCRSFPVLCNIFLFLLLTPFGAGQDGSKINIVAAPCRLWGNSTAENLARDVGGSASTVTAADGDKALQGLESLDKSKPVVLDIVDSWAWDAAHSHTSHLVACIERGAPAASWEKCLDKIPKHHVGEVQAVLQNVSRLLAGHFMHIHFVAPDVDAALSFLSSHNHSSTPGHLAAASALRHRLWSAVLAARYAVWTKLAQEFNATLSMVQPPAFEQQQQLNANASGAQGQGQGQTKAPVIMNTQTCNDSILWREASDFTKTLAFNLGELRSDYPLAPHLLNYTDGFAERLEVGDTAWPHPYVPGLARRGQPLVFSYANCGFYDMALNFLVAALAVGLQDVVLIATDTALYDALRVKYARHVIKDIPSFMAGGDTGAMRIHSKAYDHALTRRPFYYRLLLTAHIPFIYSDVDAAFLKNPLPHIPMNYTMVVQHDSRLPGLTACGCFVVLHPTVKSVMFLDLFADMYRNKQKEFDQISLKTVVRKHLYRSPLGFSFYTLPTPLFPSGWFIRKSPVNETFVKGMVWAHSNFMFSRDTKRGKLQEVGAWKAGDVPGSCSDAGAGEMVGDRGGAAGGETDGKDRASRQAESDGGTQ